MRFLTLIGLAFTGYIVTSCSQSVQPSYEVMEAKFVHKYGVPVEPHDWNARGRDGCIISTLSNGVVVSTNYASGIVDGDTTYTFPHSDLTEIVRSYSNNELAKEKTFYRSGNPKQEISYRTDGGKHIIMWYEDGTPHSIEEYDAHNSLEQGEYYAKDHELESWVDGGEGMRAVRDMYGQLQSRDTIQEGKMSCRTTYHSNGSPRNITQFNDGAIEGVCKDYLPDGEPESIAEWVNGKRHGVTTIYKNGEKTAEVSYANGLKNGVEHRFKDGKVIVEEITWKDDERHGVSKVYVGDTVKTDWFFHGKPVSRLNFEILMRSPSET